MYVFVLGWLLTVGLGLLFVLFLHKYRQWRAHQRVRQWRDSLSLAYLIIQQQNGSTRASDEFADALPKYPSGPPTYEEVMAPAQSSEPSHEKS